MASITTARTPIVVCGTRFVSRLVIVSCLVFLVALYFGFLSTPAGPRSLRAFDADRMADLELDMWQAYSRKERLRLFKGLVVTLREQYRYRWADAVRAGFHLAKAASTFGDARADYDRVLPDLEAAYAMARNWTQSRFDPAAVARAELAWWVARRIPGENSPEQVGSLIATEYALLYDVPQARLLKAALLRARAAKLRDDTGDRADWNAIGQMLRQSYRELAAAVR
jgi:hypothetical protein